MPSSGQRIAVIGAGPVGLEAALCAADAGHEVTVFEAGRVGEHLRRWGHVKMYSPWRMNRSARCAELLRAHGHALPEDGAYLTGAEHAELCLEPLAALPPLRGRVLERTRVVRVGRQGPGKASSFGAERARHPFRLLIEGPAGEAQALADVVLDASGTYGHPCWLGDGNVPALGERRLRTRIAYGLRDVAGTERPRYEGRRVLLAGSGHSAATALDALLGLDGTRVVWVVRGDRDEPLQSIPDDPLPERERQVRQANAVARGGAPRVEFRKGTAVERLRRRGAGFAVTLRTARGHEEVEVDEILAHVGHAPDGSLHRELQVQRCWATEGSMKLAASLLADRTPDCLARPAPGAATLVHPEPGFYLLGAKSYGRHAGFLIRAGLEQSALVVARLGDTARPPE